MERLIDFEWPVDRDGYEWVEQPPAPGILGLAGGWVLRGRGGPKSFYRPFEEHPGLFRRFASLRAGSRDAMLEFANEFGDLGVLFHSFDSIREAIIHFKMMVGCLDAPLIDRHGAAIIFQDMFRPRFRMTIDIENLSPVFIPETLYGAMAVQIAEEIAGVAAFRKCKNCPTWFPVGKSKGTARKEFCSPKCRVAWNRKCHQSKSE